MLWSGFVLLCLSVYSLDVAQGITFGTPQKAAPWHVGVYEVRGSNPEEILNICGGTLVKPDVVISSAVCFWDDLQMRPKNASSYKIGLGKTFSDFNKAEQGAIHRGVKEIIIPERFHGSATHYESNIAIVRLDKEVPVSKAVRPVSMWLDNIASIEGQEGQLSGWGRTEKGGLSDVLLTAKLPFVNYQTCSKNVPKGFLPFLTFDKFCAGKIDGANACPGDSGSGLLFQVPGEELPQLRGIVDSGPISSLDVLCESKYYTAFIDVSQHRDWLKKQLA